MPRDICRDNTGAVVVTYNPDDALPNRLKVVRDQVAAVLVVDNASTEGCALLRECASLPGIEFIWNETNRGVAAALNQGLEWARGKGYDWLITLDQDTVIVDSFTSALNAAIATHPDPGRIGLVGCNYIESYRREPLLCVDGSKWVEAAFAITSGMVVPIAVADRIGPFREDFFVDLVDHEYCLRARTAGYSVILVRAPLMEHKVGEPTWARLLWKRVTTPNHSPERHYYMSRNLLVVARDYLFKEPELVLRVIATRVKEVVLVICCERDRWAKLRAMGRGVFDALRGRMGPR